MNNSKNIFLQLLVGILLIGAIFLMLKNNKKRSDSMKSTYEKNKEILKNYFNGWEEENLEIIKNSLTKDYVGYNYPIMNPKGISFTKKELIKDWENRFEDIDMKYGHTIFLPGIDTINLDLDGSVRVYSALSLSINDKKIDMSFYGTYDFRNDSIYLSHEFFDFGGLMQEMKEAFEQGDSIK